MKIKFTFFISLFLLMLVTGVFWGTWYTLTRSLESFSLEEFIHIGTVIISNVAVPMRIILPLCILFMILSIVFYPAKKSLGFFLSIAALVFIMITLIITLIITLSVLVPIDNQIKNWSPISIPSGWENIRSRWQDFHTLRTFTSIAGFGCFSLSSLLISKNKR